MSIQEFIEQMESRHFSLVAAGDSLSLKANRKKLKPQEIDAVIKDKDIISFIKANKTALITHLTEVAATKKKTDEVSALYRLSGLQEGMLFYGLYDTETGAYINQFACDLLSPDVEAFEKSWQYVIGNHSILRSSFYYDAFNIPVQCVYRNIALPVSYYDYREMDTAAQDAAIAVFEDTDRRRGFDFRKAPVMRLALIRISDTRYRMVWTHHHILLDGWSVPVLLEEVLQAYEQLTAGRELLSVAEDKYEDYIRYLESRDKEADEAFWRNYLKDASEACLLPFVAATADRTRGLGSYATEKYLAGAGVTARIEAYAQRQHITVNTVMQGVWALLLQRYTGRDEATFGVTVSGRPEELPGVERRIGMFINTLPVYTTSKGATDIAAWLQQLQLEQLQCRDYQYTTLNDIQRCTGIQGDLFDTILVFENYPVSEAAAAAASTLQLENVFFHEQTNYPLDIMVETGKELIVSFNYNTSLLEEFYAKQICRHFEHVLLQIIDGGARQLQDVSLTTAEEKRMLVEAFNDTARAYDLTTTFYHAVEKYAVETPDKTAIICNNRQLSYRQLNDRVNTMSAGINKRVKIGEDEFAAVFMDRSENMAAVILSLWKLGAAYIPIEKKLPDNRIISILEDAGVKTMIAERNLVSVAMADKIQQICELIYTDELLNDAPATNPGLPFNPHSLSFSVFTSGSTGKPKGAMSEHIGMMNHAFATVDYLDMDNNSVLVQNASHSFDISVWQFFTAFIKGGTTLVYDDDVVNNAEEFLKGLMVHQVTVLQVVPTYLNLLLDLLEKEPARYPLPVKRLVCGGEILKPETVKRWFALYPGTTVVNDYGPAEASDGTCWYVFNHLPDGMEKIPVGTSIYNMHTYIVDAYMNLCPVGVVGELCVAGVGVGRGYIGDPEKTAAAFTTDPFLPHKNQRLYKTGDLARYLPGGLLEFHGRKDYQVKVNGQRIELGEIEAKLAQLHAVKDAAVIAADDANGRKYLSAFVVFHEGQSVAFTVIKEQLSGELPPYMVPRQFQELDVLPVNANGKVDRKLLARMSAAVVTENEFVAAEQDVEKILAAAWQLVLKKEKVGVTDNFYECGGDSISAIQVASQVYRQGYKVEIKDIMKLPTIRELSLVVKPLKVTAEQGEITGFVPLTPIQADFFAMEKAVPHHYNQSVLLQAAKPVNETAMRAALLELSNFHDVLRTIFPEDNGKKLQYIRPAGVEVPLTVNDWRQESDAAGRMEEAAGLLQASLHLSSGPLMKAAIFRLPAGDHLFITIHHLLVDAVSWRIILEDLFSLYDQQLRQQKTSLPAKTDAFRRWSEGLAQYANGTEFRQEIDYWQRMLTAVNAAIPIDGDTQNAASVKDIREHSVRLSEEITTQLTRQAHTAFNTDINDLLLAALGLATARVFGMQQLQLMLESHGRPDILKDISVSRTVGWFTAEYPVCLDLRQVGDLALHIKHTKELLHKVPHNGIGYGLAKYSVTGSTLRHTEKPQLVFNYLGATGDDLPEGDFRLLEHAPGAVESPLNKSDYALELIGFLRENQLVITVYYSEIQFHAGTISRWMEAYKEALETVTALCTGGTIREYTPSDYDYKDLSIEELNQLNALFE